MDFASIPKLFDPIEGEEYLAPTLSTDQPERAPILLPSQFGKDTLNHLAIIPFTKQEIKLREGQANDALDGLRLALSRSQFSSAQISDIKKQSKASPGHGLRLMKSARQPGILPSCIGSPIKGWSNCLPHLPQ